MDKQDAIRKIKAALGLAGSANEHEAAAAARQAQALMAKYRIEEGDLRLAEVEEKRAKAGAKSKPVAWEGELAQACADAFGCKLIFGGGWNGGYWIFVGVNPAGQLSQYAFEVLFRACKKARNNYMGVALRRYKSIKNKTAKADLYAEGWVQAVKGNLSLALPTETQRQTIADYMEKEHPKLGTLQPRQNTGRPGSDDWRHSAHGMKDGDGVNLRQGVATGGAPKMIGQG